MLEAIALVVLGAIVGWGIRVGYVDAAHITAETSTEKENKELWAQVRELRAWKALHIGRDTP